MVWFDLINLVFIGFSDGEAVSRRSRSDIVMCLNSSSSSSEKHQKVSNLSEIRETLKRVMSR
jgi:hypothetical protein